MFVYRYLPSTPRYISYDEYPIVPFASLEDALNLTHIHHEDMLETMWIKNESLSFMLSRDDIVYYFILPFHIPDVSNDYRRIFVEDDVYDERDDETDYYAKMRLRSIVSNLSCRIRTRNAIEDMYSTINANEPTYHEQVIEFLTTMKNNNEYDTMILRRHLQDEQEMINIERHYRPGGQGYKDAQDDFEELAMLTSWKDLKKKQ
jgi:hypothetical protein